MSNHLNIPKLWPFKMLPNTATPGEHFNDDWARNQIRNWERRVFYNQKWIRSYTTKLQITSTIEPESLKLVDINGAEVKAFAWTLVGAGPGTENAYNCTYDVTDVATDGLYFLYLKAELLAVKFEAISEPIEIKNTHRNVRPFVYSHSKNEFGVIWTLLESMTFMCESDMPANEYTFERDRNSYVDQVHNVTTLSAYPYNTAKLLIAEPTGVAPYIIDIVNRILCCENVVYNGLRIESNEGAKWEIAKVKGYPLIGGAIDVVPAKNLTTLQFNNIDLIPGFVMMYNINANFFGEDNVVIITEFEMI